jgi:hypothetical protein
MQCPTVMEGFGNAESTVVMHGVVGFMPDKSDLLSEMAFFALHIRWTRDPFDRIICAQAACTGTRLLTKDTIIRSHFKKALWD